MTGFTEAECRANNVKYAVSTVQGVSHASYYPGSQPVAMKIVYEPVTGKLLGGQAVGGTEGVDKRYGRATCGKCINKVLTCRC